ncbi:response regulator transcription factor [Desulfuromonas acetoxidans]|uniref:Two component transcriptional regulator, winged helix family n=1 Tax=Desulfuromonas acetoxidans (strain DSM 684 / 11070) TaxID=281689 RepID=Q1K4F9_DESA6|nr:response regulator transcription factor [Desulfuromonas acetoxidans]EAT17144.1 two component transcriptional regulator, winged helix family [Desulfuromonas acetoxidans DSM 684]MBF0646344.1 response regulator transcription factor [Desulfuromonas acetoxidans]NVD24269.1 response regulator transcription factor [Desulfuromonas acetoxidans]NVE14958.1 response regulator transcription factor [Desulfuromonas acetoxidans]
MSDDTIRILLVEDEQHIAQGLIFNLQQEGYEVIHAITGEEALHSLDKESFSLAILDRMLPGKIDGLEICRHIRRADPQLPVLMLTAMNREQDRVAGLGEGADDYLGKPFSLDELLLRVAGMLRRQAWYRPAAPRQNNYHLGQYDVDLKTGQLTDAEGHNQQTLTELELKMLRLFIDNEGEILSRAFLLKSVWGMAPDTETRTLDNFIVRLRKYFEQRPSHPRYFLTVRGRGYRFTNHQQ